MNNQCWVPIMACLHLPMAATRINKGVHVLFMWPAALCSGLAALSCAGCNFEEIFQHLKERNTLKRFSSSLNVIVGYLCAQACLSGLECW